LTTCGYGEQIRDAVPEDASAACEVLRRSISELCGAVHRNDPEILTQWLKNQNLIPMSNFTAS
jgi:hypothetical protein